MYRLKQIASSILALILTISIVPNLRSTALAANDIPKNKKVLNYISESNLVVIGDSRIYDVYRYIGGKKERKASFYAIRGGIYLNTDIEYQTDKEGNIIKEVDRRILAKERIQKVEKNIRKILKKHGKCTVVVGGTINECNFTEDGSIETYVSNHLIRYAKSLTKIKETYKNKRKKKKKVSPVVYVATAPGAHSNYTYHPSRAEKYRQVVDYNDAIRNQCVEKHLNLLDFTMPNDDQFKEDQLHFPVKKSKKAYNRQLWKEIAAVK